MKLKATVVSILFFIAITCSSHTFADTRYVCADTGNDSNDGSSWETAKATIEAALDIAYSHDTIMLAAGEHILTHQVVVAKPVTITSASGFADTGVNGDNGITSNRCFYVKNTQEPVIFDNLTIGKGYTPDDGAAIYAEPGCNVQIYNCWFLSNIAEGNGGAVVNAYLRRCLINDNISENGGALYNCVVDNSILYQNKAESNGGASCYSTLNNCMILANEAQIGGATFNCDLYNCTVIHNLAYYMGGGAHAGKIYNSILKYNKADYHNDISGTEEIYNSCSSTIPPGKNNINEYPYFVEDSSGYGIDANIKDPRLKSISPCIDAGDNSYAPTNFPWDFQGNLRIWNGTVDMGAHEYGSTIPPPENVTATAGEYFNKVVITWDAHPTAYFYEIWVSTNNSHYTATKLDNIATNSYEHTTTIRGTVYYYWVRAEHTYNISDFSISASGFSKPEIPLAPTGIFASDGTYNDKIRITWNEVTGATSYEIWRSKNNNSASGTEITESA